LQIPILHRRFLRCRGCALRWIPERGAAPACPACGSKDLRRRFEPAHLGVLLLVAGVVSAAAGHARAPAEPRALLGETARIEVKRLDLPVEAGPLRGRTVTLRRGDVVMVKDRAGSTLLVEDAKGNRFRVKAKHVALP